MKQNEKRLIKMKHEAWIYTNSDIKYTSVFPSNMFWHMSIVRQWQICLFSDHFVSHNVNIFVWSTSGWRKRSSRFWGLRSILGSDSWSNLLIHDMSPDWRQAIIWTMLEYCWLDHWEQTSMKSQSNFIHCHSRKCIWKCRLENGGHFGSASMC